MMRASSLPRIAVIAMAAGLGLCMGNSALGQTAAFGRMSAASMPATTATATTSSAPETSATAAGPVKSHVRPVRTEADKKRIADFQKRIADLAAQKQREDEMRLIAARNSAATTSTK